LMLCTFSPQLRLCINFDRNGLGHIFGDIFTNSSGHPGKDQQSEGLGDIHYRLLRVPTYPESMCQCIKST
jgi:hypothetical protein